MRLWRIPQIGHSAVACRAGSDWWGDGWPSVPPGVQQRRPRVRLLSQCDSRIRVRLTKTGGYDIIVIYKRYQEDG